MTYSSRNSSVGSTLVTEQLPIEETEMNNEMVSVLVTWKP